MKKYLIYCLFLSNSLSLFGQLTVADLDRAIKNDGCAVLAAELATMSFSGVPLKFRAAICIYRNGDVEQALAMFQQIRAEADQPPPFAAYWSAKCQASLGQDSLAIASLSTIPLDILRPQMLAQREFERLKNNEKFTRLQQSVAPGFNVWTGLLAVVAAIGLLLGAVLLFGKSRFSAGERWLSVVMFAFGIILTSYVLIWTKYSSVFPYLLSVWQFLTFLVGPSLYFYLKATFKEDISRKEIAFHYAAPALSLLLTLPYILTNFGIQTGLSSDFFTVGASSTLLTGHLLFYAVLIHGMTHNEWQVDANIKLWTKVVSWGMNAYTIAFLSYFVLMKCSFFNPEWDYAICTVMALGILAIAYMGLVQKRVFSSEPISHFLPVKKYQTSSLTDSASLSIKKGMERLLNEEQVFKENELRLADLAAYLDVSYHQLSQVINEHYGVNFFELINRYRVAHVKKLLADPNYSHYTIIQIAYEAGFNNKASFNRYFKKAIGMTPSAYRIRENQGVR
ncbi:MAG: helix-turn-helix domain-containing protein [Bacteroidota bacterium]